MMTDICILAGSVMLTSVVSAAPAQAGGAPSHWAAPDRGAKVAALIPGRRVPRLTAETLFADWTEQQVERWNGAHAALSPEEAYRKYAGAEPTDAELTADFPAHISPFGRVRSGRVDGAKAAVVMISFCPFCQSRALSLKFEGKTYDHAVTSCCRTHLYRREQDYPRDYALRPNASVKFLHLDDTWHEAPCTLYRDQQGVEWELFIKTVFDHRRWVAMGCNLVKQYGGRFRKTADPLYAHKIAVILDKVADTYYGLPLSFQNTLAKGKDGRPLTRSEWEAVPRPAVFSASYLGPWNRRLPLGSKGWLNMFDEHIWVEPFARVRHHPAFKHYSQKHYRDPDALDRKIRTKLLRELKLMFESCFSQRLKSNYQEANYAELMVLGILLEDESLFDFAVPCQELTLYNHHYHDGINGEGAPNYMAMLKGYYYPYMQSPTGWLEFEPDFGQKNPFFGPASREWRKLHTVRGLSLEFADQHMSPFDRRFIIDRAKVGENEKLPSMNWPAFGVGILRVGGPGHRQEIRLSYDKVSLHGASDKLGIGCWVDGVPVMRPGGYAAHWHCAVLDKSRPEGQAFFSLSYPREIVEANTSPRNWCWEYAHSHLAQNAVSVNELGTSPGWRDDEGFGELIAFKGGETAGRLGANFQILDVRDHDSFDRVGVEVSRFRRALLAVEGPDGRPYAVDVLKLRGGQRHALYQSAWAERADDKLPPVVSTEASLATALLGGRSADGVPRYGAYEKVRQVEVLGSTSRSWELEWKTDYAAYAARDPEGKPFVRPLPDHVGRVRLRLIGLRQEGETQLLRAKGPWVAWIRQPLPGGRAVSGNVGFLDACDFLIESRTIGEGQGDGTLDSTFLHILEGFREGEKSAIESVERLLPVEGPKAALALRLQLASGCSDTVIFQPEPGRVRLKDGVETDGQYVLVRRGASGELVEANVVRGTSLKCGKFSARYAGDLRGTIVDLIGDLTGTRVESALIVRPAGPWPLGEGLAGRQMLIRVTNPVRSDSNEAYAIKQVAALPDGLLRVDLANHAPFAAGWHQVALLDPDRSNALKTNRPFSAGINTSWLHGLKVWFPRLGQTYTFKKTDSANGTEGAMDLELVEDVDLAAEGIRLGDWFAVYAIEPGLKVTVPGELAWRREPLQRGPAAGNPIRYYLRSTGTAEISMPRAEAPTWRRQADGKWQPVEPLRDASSSATTITVHGRYSAGRAVALVARKPEWLKLNDSGPPQITKILLDGKPLELKPVLDLGRITLPRELVVQADDDDNPIDVSSIAVAVDGKTIDSDDLVAVQMARGNPRSVTIEVSLAPTLGAGRLQELPTRHSVTVTLDDLAVDQAATSLRLSFSRLIKIAGNAIYLSDVKQVSARVHGGLKKDTDYFGQPMRMRGVLYAKCLYAGPEYAEGLAYSEIIYDLPQHPRRRKLCATIGICDNYLGVGLTRVVFQVQVDRDGEWQTRYKSPTMSGATEPLAISVDISDAKRLRLYCQDTGDGINADYAVWADARLER